MKLNLIAQSNQFAKVRFTYIIRPQNTAKIWIYIFFVYLFQKRVPELNALYSPEPTISPFSPIRPLVLVSTLLSFP